MNRPQVVSQAERQVAPEGAVVLNRTLREVVGRASRAVGMVPDFT